MQIYNRQAALALLEDDKGLLSILEQSFSSENKFEKDVIEKFIAENKSGEAASYVHATKGAARQLCMEKLQDSAQKLEDVLRGKKNGSIKSLTDKMAADYAEVLKTLGSSKS